MENGCVIVGGGQASVQLCSSLRGGGYMHPILMISDENQLPYKRPPLSKDYLKGQISRDKLSLRDAEWYAAQNIEVQLGRRALKLDTNGKTLELDDGTLYHYDKMVLATGSRPRQLVDSKDKPKNVFNVRTVSDIDRIKPFIVAGNRVAIIGGGYIGLEAAAVTRQLGLETVVVEASNRVLARVTSPFVSNFFQSLHEKNGVEFVKEVRFESFEVNDKGQAIAVKLSDGTQIPCDVVLVGIGVLPNQELADDAGLNCANGIVVDEQARTSHPDIYAIGDCSYRPLGHYEGNGRLESVHNAIEQGKIAAASINAQKPVSLDCPWFWSDQYDVKLQTAGLLNGYDALIVRGHTQTHHFSVFYYKNKKLIAADCINSPPEFMATKKLIVAGKTIDPDIVGDLNLSAKDLIQKSY